MIMGVGGEPQNVQERIAEAAEVLATGILRARNRAMGNAPEPLDRSAADRVAAEQGASGSLVDRMAEGGNR